VPGTPRQAICISTCYQANGLKWARLKYRHDLMAEGGGVMRRLALLEKPDMENAKNASVTSDYSN
jgi:hypothetical protein